MLAEFSRYLAEHVPGESTRRAYLKDLRLVLSRLPETDRWTPESVDAAVAQLARTVSPSAHRRRVAALRHFCRFLGRDDIAARIGRGAPRLPVRPAAPRHRVLTDEEIHRLLAVVDGDAPEQVRDRILVLLMLLGGLKPGEIAALRVRDLDLEVSCLRVGGREGRILPLSREMADLLRGYAQQRKGEDEPLFRSARGAALTEAGVDWVLRRALAAAGIGGVTSRDLRLTAVHLLQRRGADLSALQRFLGLRSAAAAARYLAPAEARTLNPFEGLA